MKVFALHSHPARELGLSVGTLFAALWLCASQGFAQSPLETLDGPHAGAQFGALLEDPGDVDADGIGDLLVGAPGATPSTGLEEAGWLGVLSGRTGAVLREWWGQTAGEHFGAVAAGVGDVNADGVPDIAVARSVLGVVEVYSGADGGLLHSFAPVQSKSSYTASLDGVGDWNGDGYDDVVVGYPRSSWGSGAYAVSRVGVVELYSGADGSLLRYWIGPQKADYALGTLVCGLGDVDGNGSVDFAASSDSSTYEEVRVYSGPVGGILATFHLSSFYGPDLFGSDIAAAGDVNGDGVLDILIGAPAHYDPAQSDWVGAFYLYSATGGEPLQVFLGDVPWGWFGREVAGGRDIDLDGVPDLVTANSDLLQVYSGATGELVHAWSVADLVGEPLTRAFALVGDRDRNGGGELVVGFPTAAPAGPASGQALVLAGCDGRWNHYGSGAVGTGGVVPEIDGAFCPIPGQAVEVRVTRGVGGGAGVLLVGLAKVHLPVLGGTLLVANPLFLPYALDGKHGQPAAGSGLVPWSVPADPALSGLHLFLQSWIVDGLAPGGFAATRGLELTIG